MVIAGVIASSADVAQLRGVSLRGHQAFGLLLAVVAMALIGGFVFGVSYHRERLDWLAPIFLARGFATLFLLAHGRAHRSALAGPLRPPAGDRRAARLRRHRRLRLLQPRGRARRDLGRRHRVGALRADPDRRRDAAAARAADARAARGRRARDRRPLRARVDAVAGRAARSTPAAAASRCRRSGTARRSRRRCPIRRRRRRVAPSPARPRSIAAIAMTAPSKVGLWQGLRTMPTSSPSRVTAAPYSGTSSPSIRSVVSSRGVPSAAIARSASRPTNSAALSSLTTLSRRTSNGSVWCGK